jgi:hypothetical protein
MPGKSQFYENQVLNTERGTTLTAPANMYAGLFGVLPANDGAAGTEITGNAYARQLCGFAAPSGMGPASIANAADILFPVQTPAGYGNVVGVGTWDASTVGNLKKFVGITTINFATGSQAKFAAGALISTED